MKKVLLCSAFMALSMCLKLQAQNIWASGFTATVNGTTTNYGLLTPATLGNGQTTTDLGTLNSLVLNGGTILTTKSNTQNVCGGILHYVVYPSGSRPDDPVFNSVTLTWKDNCSGEFFPDDGTVAAGKACSNNDQQWSDIEETIDLTSSLSSNGSYTLEIYYQATGSSSSTDGCGESFYDNNSNNPTNYTVTFNYQATALPVHLINFSATSQGGRNVIQWQTAQETNNKGFEIQAGTDGKTFSDVAFVVAEGNNSSYTYIDNSTNNFYRLKQIDNDGNTHFSDVVAVNSYKNIAVKVYPNPAKNSITVLGEGTVNIYDASGKFVLSQPTKNGAAQIDISALPKGFYFVAIGKSAIKIIKN